MGPHERLKELGWELPAVTAPVANYVPTRLWGNTLYLSGSTSGPGCVGKVGADISLEQAKEGARQCVLVLLSRAAAALGSLDKVEQVLKLTVFINSAPGFTQQPAVGNGASDALVAIFGEAGRHARSAIGVAELPGGTAVEVEMILGVRN